PRPGPAGGPRRRDRLAELDAAPRLRLARPARLRAGAAARLQSRDRLLRDRRGRRLWRRTDDRKDRRRVIGVLASGDGASLQALLDQGLPVMAVASNDTKAPAPSRAARAGLQAAA